MELRLIVEARGRRPREVVTEVEPVHPVSELVAALASHLELDGDRTRLGLYCRRIQGWLDTSQEIATAGLRTGDRVDLWDRTVPLTGPMPDEGPAAVADLLVVGGPDAGRRVPLAIGEHRLGSFRYASIMLEDPSLSRVHVVIAVSSWGVVTVSDAGSETGTFVGGRQVAGPTQVEPGQLVVCGHSLLAFQRHGERPAVTGQAPSQDRAGQVAFNRPPRVALSKPPGAFTLPGPPARNSPYALPVASALVMTAMGTAMYFGTGRQPYMLAFLALSPLMVVGGWLDSKVGGGWTYRRQAEKYRERIRALDNELSLARTEEARYVQAQSPDAVTLVDRARAVDVNLWERRPDSPDWLLLRVGWSDRPSSVSLEVKGNRDEEVEPQSSMRQEAMAMAERHRWLPTSPVTVSLQEAGVVGLSGDQKLVIAAARWLCLQLAVLHSPQDLVLAAIVPDAERDEWAWLDWLPHLHSESSPLPGSLIATDRASAYGLIDRFLTLLGERTGDADSASGSGERFEPSVVLLLREGVALPRGALAELLRRGPAVGIHAIWVGAHGHALPGECGAVIEAEPGSLEPVVSFPGRGESSRGGGLDGISVETATGAALALAPVRDVSSRQRQSGVPRGVHLLGLLGIRDDPERAILGAWIRDRSGQADRELSALLGVAAAGAPFDVSLRFDGPHALVGGMTGSGKSELLQSLVAALAARHSPRTLSFLLVDYKGGAAFKDCVALPHTVGFVTDLDGHLVDRALVSLRAELRRREEILRQAGAKDLPDLEHSDPERAPPSLVIVVDEFAALATELPQFVDGMVDVAQRGRSLGIHLVLATQRPAGVINDKIRANTNLRISLRFGDEEESIDVVGTPEAARPGLPPGRAFARVGPGAVIEFQAGYVGGHTAADRGPAPVAVRDVNFGAAAAAPGGRRVAAGGGATDLQRLVTAAVEVNRRLGLPAPPRPWLPTLPEVLPLEALPRPDRSAAGAPRATIGLVDDPAGQRQYPLQLGLGEDAGLLVFGATGSGKTTVLRSLAASLASTTAAGELHIYALDFASRGLTALQALPCCGGVIAGDEPERAMRLLTMLRAEADRRKSLLAGTATTSVDEYLATGAGERLPRLVVLLDGVPGFMTACEEAPLVGGDELLLQLVGEGRPLGITFVLAASRIVGLANKLAANIGRRLALRMSSEDEYSLMGLPRSVYAEAHLPPGRGFTERGLDVQCAVVGSDPAGSAQAAAVARLGAELAGLGRAVAIPQVGVLPRRLDRRSLPAPASPLEAVVGIGDARLEPARVDLRQGHFLVTGPRDSGRTTALASLATSLAAGPGAPMLLLLAAGSASPLAGLGVWASTALGPEACGELVRELAAAARSGEVGAGTPVVLVVDDGEDLPQDIEDLEWIAERGRERGLRIVAAVPNHVAQRAYGGWLVHVLRDRQGLLLDPDTALDAGILNVRLPPRQKGAWPPGRGYLACRGSVELVQVAGDSGA